MNASPVLPPALHKGDTIGVVSTSCWLEESDLIAAKDFVEAQGYKVYIHPQATCRLHQSAGNSAEKITALHDLYANPNIKAIIGARGGNRASTLLGGLDYDLIRKNPKPLIGYSDLTALLNGIYAQTGVIGFHGGLFRELPKREEFAGLMAMLSGTFDTLNLSEATTLQEGEAEGILLGGNLSVLQGLIGTPYLPDMTNAILILEDVGDHLSRYDRMLIHLKNAGILGKISGLILGSFSNTKDDEDRPFGFILEDIVREHTQGLSIPIILDAPFGHGDKLKTLPIGIKTHLKNAQLSFKPQME